MYHRLCYYRKLDKWLCTTSALIPVLFCEMYSVCKAFQHNYTVYYYSTRSPFSTNAGSYKQKLRHTYQSNIVQPKTESVLHTVVT